jgi:hypothetical protein
MPNFTPIGAKYIMLDVYLPCMEDLLAYLNPWWKTGVVPDNRVKGKVQRRSFIDLVTNMDNDKIISVIGPRSAGKTTLIYQLVDNLIRNNVSPKRILYFTFDIGKKGSLRDVLETFARILGEPLDSLSGRIYVFLDEIQKLENWEDDVKFWQDLKFEMKIVLSGSSTHGILRGSGESLVGRISFIWLYPFTFREFLDTKGTVLPVLPGMDFDLGTFRKAHSALVPIKREIQMHFEDFLIKGGFPEVSKYDTETAWHTLRTYYELVLSRDIITNFGVRNINELKALTVILAESCSDRINYTNIATELGVKISTVKKYLYYLESALLIKLSYVYSPKKRVSERKEKKVFFIDNGLRNALSMKSKETLEKGRVVENVVFTHILISMARAEINPVMFYWIDNNRKEVDFILQATPIEVKYSDRIDRRELQGMHLYMERYGIEKGIVLTKDTLDVLAEGNKQYLLVPVWLFVLLVS